MISTPLYQAHWFWKHQINLKKPLHLVKAGLTKRLSDGCSNLLLLFINFNVNLTILSHNKNSMTNLGLCVETSNFSLIFVPIQMIGSLTIKFAEIKVVHLFICSRNSWHLKMLDHPQLLFSNSSDLGTYRLSISSHEEMIGKCFYCDTTADNVWKHLTQPWTIMWIQKQCDVRIIICFSSAFKPPFVMLWTCLAKYIPISNLNNIFSPFQSAYWIHYPTNTALTQHFVLFSDLEINPGESEAILSNNPSLATSIKLCSVCLHFNLLTSQEPKSH